MRAIIAKAVIIIFVLMIMVHPAMATVVIGIPFTSIGCSAFMMPLSSTACTIEEFNSASAFANSAETLGISFPLSSDSLLKGSAANTKDAGISSPDGSQTPSAVSFGPVDLAFPSIAQAANENTGAQRTYFFTDTF